MEFRHSSYGFAGRRGYAVFHRAPKGENLERLIRIAMALIGATMGIGFRVQGMFNSFGS